MVALNRIYTRTGDDGTTALGTGRRVPKFDPRVDAYGTVDETNAAIGLARSLLGAADPVLDAQLARIQNDLFDLGADLCVPDDGSAKAGARLRVSPEQVARLESEIDSMNAELEPLRSFVLPGGSAGASALHIARTVCRRAERAMVALAAVPGETLSEASIKYVNRLSDYLFVASRWANNKGRGDVLWVPGQNR